MSLTDYSQLAPGVTISCRDEHWLVGNVARTTDGFRIRARGVSDDVRDTTATFYTALVDIKVFDPANVTFRPDESPQFRHSRLWLESTLRRMPVPLYKRTERWLTPAGEIPPDVFGTGVLGGDPHAGDHG